MSGNTKDKIAVRNNAGKTTPAATAPMENAYVNATVLEKIKNLAATFRPRKCNETSSRFLFLSTKVSRGKKEAQQIGYITRRCTSSDYHAEKPYVSRGKKDTQKIGYITRRCTSSDYLAENPRLVAEKRKHIKSGELLALDCLGWDSEGLYLLVGDCNSLSNARLLTPHSLLFQVTSSELVEVAGG
ncbi:hypothetical protein F2Q68_00020211 [Brassica cretica]|uniref:Uncharacterized protein n=1 Tax=Brassica cretica TaxID=69181 RepID=A0A8S9FMF8_BRACR|nr:hypothetical protein F2Q68_00020211 [Brassica cretica]